MKEFNPEKIVAQLQRALEADPEAAELYHEFRAAYDKPDEVKGSLHDRFFHYVMTKVRFAADFLKVYLSDWNETLDFDRLRIVTSNYFTDDFKEFIPDIVYAVPTFADPSVFTIIPLIVEHKAQNSFADNKRALINLMQYLYVVARKQLEAAAPNPGERLVPQPIPLVVYTGSDVNYVPPRWGDFFYLPKRLENYLIQYEFPCVNLTKMFKENAVVGSPLTRMVANAFGIAACRSYDKDYLKLVQPLVDFIEWDDDQFAKEIVRAAFYYFTMTARRVKMPVSDQTIGEMVQMISSVDLQTASEHAANLIAMGYPKDEVESYGKRIEEKAFDEGREEGREEGRIEEGSNRLGYYINRRFGFVPVSISEKLKHISSMTELDTIWDCVFQEQSLTGIEEQIDRVLSLS